jgi:hypothetical protein
MTEPMDKYDREKNSDELSRKFHERAGEVARDLNKQLLTLSTGIVAAFFFLVFNKSKDFDITEKTFILISIILFGLSILFTILGMQWDSSKYYFLGQINDSSKQVNRSDHEKMKRKYNKKQLNAKTVARVLFLSGILSAITFFSIYLFS